MGAQIHWHEGLFLQQHHLQRNQKAQVDALSAERRLAWAFPYGVIEARISVAQDFGSKLLIDQYG